MEWEPPYQRWQQGKGWVNIASPFLFNQLAQAACSLQ